MARERSKEGGRLSQLGPAWLSAIGTLLAALIAGVALYLSNQSPGGDGGSGQVIAGRPVQAPATISPVVGECSQKLQIGADGNASPLTCDGGKLNVLAWSYYGKNSPLVMTLGPDAIPDQVLRAMCSDVRNSTPVIEKSAYTLAALYYGWNFGIDPAQELTSGGC